MILLTILILAFVYFAIGFVWLFVATHFLDFNETDDLPFVVYGWPLFALVLIAYGVSRPFTFIYRAIINSANRRNQ